MSELELKNLAESMGLKKVNSSTSDELISKIIDQQALDSVAATVAERQNRTESQ